MCISSSAFRLLGCVYGLRVMTRSQVNNLARPPPSVPLRWSSQGLPAIRAQPGSVLWSYAPGAPSGLYGWGAPVPADAPPSRTPLVELEWKLFREESGQVAVARRVWAPTIGEALQTMIEDRRTDIALEQIEQAATEQEDGWWND